MRQIQVQRQVLPYAPRVVDDLFPGTKEFPERVPYSPHIDLYDELKREDVKRAKPNLFVSNFNFIKKNLIFNRVKIDWMHLMVGMEGTGKSNCGIRDCTFIDDGFLKQDLKILPQCIYSKRDLDYFLDLVKRKVPPYDRRGTALFFDEAHTFFFGKDSLTKESREMQKFLMGARAQYGFFYLLGMQYFQDFNTYIRNSRGRSLGRTHWEIDRKTLLLDVGYVEYYSREKFLQIKMDTQRRLPVWPSSDFTGRFPKAPDVIDIPLSLKKVDFLNKEGDYEYLKNQKTLKPTVAEKIETKQKVDEVEAWMDKDYEKLLEIQESRKKKTGKKLDIVNLGLKKSTEFKSMADSFAEKEL